MEEYLKAFVMGAAQVEKHGLQFDKVKYDILCEQVTELANNIRGTLAPEQTRFLYDWDINNKASIYLALSQIAQGVNPKYAEYINKMYYEAEDGSVSENVYDSIRRYMKHGRTYTECLFDKYFVDTMGGIRIDSNHVRIFLDAMRNISARNLYGYMPYMSKDFEINLKLMYVALRADELYNAPFSKNIVLTDGKTRKSEYDGFRAYLRKGIITPNYNTQFSLSWVGCNQVTLDYVMSLCQPEGFNCYYYHKPGVTLKSLVATMNNCSMEQAHSIIKNTKSGFIYRALSKQVEDKFLPQLLSGDFSHFDGVYGKQIEKWFYEGYGATGAADYYGSYVAKTVQNETGKILYTIFQELRANGVSFADCYVYWIKDDRFAIAVRKNLILTSILPTTHHYLKPLPQANYVSVLNKSFCSL